MSSKQLKVRVLAVLLFAGSAAAQTVNFARPLRINPANCPVDLQVEHADSLKQSRAHGVSGDVLPPSPDQRVRLTLTNLESSDVASVQITAQGFSSKGRLVDLSEAAPLPDVTKKMALDLPLKGSAEISRELSLTGFSEVAFIDVDSLTYVDGNTWRAAFAGSCRVTPDLLMRVAASR